MPRPCSPLQEHPVFVRSTRGTVMLRRAGLVVESVPHRRLHWCARFCGSLPFRCTAALVSLLVCCGARLLSAKRRRSCLQIFVDCSNASPGYPKDSHDRKYMRVRMGVRLRAARARSERNSRSPPDVATAAPRTLSTCVRSLSARADCVSTLGPSGTSTAGCLASRRNRRRTSPFSSRMLSCMLTMPSAATSSSTFTPSARAARARPTSSAGRAGSVPRPRATG